MGSTIAASKISIPAKSGTTLPNHKNSGKIKKIIDFTVCPAIDKSYEKNLSII
jgi:hypothetical protein